MSRKLLGLIIGGLLLVVLVPALINWPEGDGGIDQKQQGRIIILYSVEEKSLIKVPLEQYLVGVVAAEMPAEFEEEALKAQAVAARTYVVRRIQSKNFGHPLLANVCDDPAHCQAWLSDKKLKEKWGNKFRLYIEKVQRAVSETRGQIIIYAGVPIDPVYHGSCGGIGTLPAEVVWGEAIPYLQTVRCNFDDKNNPKLTSEMQVSLVEFKLRIGKPKSNDTEMIKGIETATYLDGKHLAQMKVGGTTITGKQIREKLKLPSSVIKFKICSRQVIIRTEGKGHGVGLCQYGANGMAQRKISYKAILAHYYQGTNLVKM